MKQAKFLSTRFFFFLFAFCFSLVVFAQDSSGGGGKEETKNSTTTTTTTKSTDINITADGDTWYTQPWVWIVGAAVFILLLVALLSSNRGKDTVSTSDRVTVKKTVERDTDRGTV